MPLFICLLFKRLITANWSNSGSLTVFMRWNRVWTFNL
jgi:hypothetical protein